MFNLTAQQIAAASSQFTYDWNTRHPAEVQLCDANDPQVVQAMHDAKAKLDEGETPELRAAFSAAVDAYRADSYAKYRAFATNTPMRTAAQLLVQAEQEITECPQHHVKGTGVYAIRKAAKGEDAAALAIEAYQLAADAPADSWARETYAKIAEASRRVAMDMLWQVKLDAKDAHGTWDLTAVTRPAYMALAALQLAIGYMAEVATAYIEEEKGAEYKSWMGFGLDAEAGFRECAYRLAHQIDAEFERERAAAFEDAQYWEAVARDRWDADLMTARRAERGLPVAV